MRSTKATYNPQLENIGKLSNPQKEIRKDLKKKNNYQISERKSKPQDPQP